MSMGSRASDLLDTAALSAMTSQFLVYANNGQLTTALEYVTSRLQSELEGITPATVMIIVTMVSIRVL